MNTYLYLIISLIIFVCKFYIYLYLEQKTFTDTF